MGGGGGVGTGRELYSVAELLRPLSRIHKNLGEKQIGGGGASLVTLMFYYFMFSSVSLSMPSWKNWESHSKIRKS